MGGWGEGGIGGDGGVGDYDDDNNYDHLNAELIKKCMDSYKELVTSNKPINEKKKTNTIVRKIRITTQKMKQDDSERQPTWM